MASDTEPRSAGRHRPPVAPGSLPASERELAERAAAGLSPLERDVLALSAGHGLSSRDIAAKLGISEWRAERILVRALGKFCRAMERQPRPWWHVFRSVL